MHRPAAACAVIALVLGSIIGSGRSSEAGSQQSAPGDVSFRALDAPVRVLDTRAEQRRSTADSTLELALAGRAGVPDDAAVVAVNLTAVDASDQGFVTAHPCDEDRPNTSNLNVAAGDTIAVGAFVRPDDDGALCLHTSSAMDLLVDVTGYFPEGGVDVLDVPQRLLDTREASATVDGRFERIGTRDVGSTLELDVTGRGDVAADTAPVALTVTAVAGPEPGYLTVHPCDGERPVASSLNMAAEQTIANMVVSRVDPDGRVCLYTSVETELIVDVTASLTDSSYRAFRQPHRILDTRTNGGLRPTASTLQVDVAGRAGVPSDAGAVVMNVTVVDALSSGYATLHPAGVERPEVSNINASAGDTRANAVTTRLGSGGAVCLYADASAHYLIDVVGWLPGTPAAPEGDDCPDPPLFPTYRMVALYGTDASDQMGALGEQSPEEAAQRLAEVIEPWTTGDRPVLGVFELIATIATRAPGPDGLYRSVDGPERVRRYLEVARDHGYYLLLDIQPGRSDFLTEVQRYEEFIREPDVGIALDPEWRMGPGEVPGDLVGQVSAAEVNEVSRYLADIVDEEGLPQKLLVIHQFQDRMITDRDDLIAPPQLAVNIHMDGFGTRDRKLDTYSVTQVEPPLWNGFKLFYDEDVDIFQPSDVLEIDPVPDFISYQ